MIFLLKIIQKNFTVNIAKCFRSLGHDFCKWQLQMASWVTNACTRTDAVPIIITGTWYKKNDIIIESIFICFLYNSSQSSFHCRGTPVAEKTNNHTTLLRQNSLCNIFILTFFWLIIFYIVVVISSNLFEMSSTSSIRSFNFEILLDYLRFRAIFRILSSQQHKVKKYWFPDTVIKIWVLSPFCFTFMCSVKTKYLK